MTASAPVWSAGVMKVKNTSEKTLTFTAGGKKIVLPPGEITEIPKEDAEHPVIYRMLYTKILTVTENKLTFEDCEEDDHDGYCYMDLAQQDKSTLPCAYYDMWSAAKECLYYVDRERKLTAADCNVFDPGSQSRKNCTDYVSEGIPSAPGRSYEETL